MTSTDRSEARDGADASVLPSDRRGFLAGIGAAVGVGAIGSPASARRRAGHSRDEPRNVILLIPDGSGRVVDTAARYYRAAKADRNGFDGAEIGDFPTNVSDVEMGIDRADVVGSVSTYPDADQLITDSGAAGTAIATGQKTYDGAIAVDHDRRPLETILERAADAGYATGLVTTSEMTHATPASFAAHVSDRGQQEEIARQYVLESDVDVFLGGDRSHFHPEERDDGVDLIDIARADDYQYVETAADLDDVSGGKVLGLFTESGHLDFYLDRENGHGGLLSSPLDSLSGALGELTDGVGGVVDELSGSEHASAELEDALAGTADGNDLEAQPGLPEMAQTAIGLLEQRSDRGFFLMVESARIDHLGHLNNFAMIPEQVEHDDTVDLAMEYAETGPGETLVVNVADHDCGGLSLGNQENGYDMDWGRLVEQDHTHWQNIPRVQAINRAAGLNFGSLVHTAQDVPVYATGPNAAYFSGHQENSDLAAGMAAHLDVA